MYFHYEKRFCSRPNYTLYCSPIFRSPYTRESWVGAARRRSEHGQAVGKGQSQDCP